MEIVEVEQHQLGEIRKWYQRAQAAKQAAHLAFDLSVLPQDLVYLALFQEAMLCLCVCKLHLIF